MSVPDLPALLGRVRELTRQYRSGTPESFAAFHELVQLLLRVTVLPGTVGVRLTRGPRTDRMIVEGAAAADRSVVQLNDGRYLRVSIILYLEPHETGHRLKVEQASYQYQSDEAGDRWVFRYDYRREPTDLHPATHLQVRGRLVEEDVAPYRGVLDRVHFPAGRVSIEAVIRLLIEQFGVHAGTPPEVWRAVLAESERPFEEIAHRPLSGPAQ